MTLKQTNIIDELKWFLNLRPRLPAKSWQLWFDGLSNEQREMVDDYLKTTINAVAVELNIDVSDINLAFESFGQAIADGMAAGVTNDPSD